MSCDAGELEHIKKCRKKSRLSEFCRTIFGCARKGKSLVGPVKSYNSIAVQCQLEIELKTTYSLEETISAESNEKLDVTIVKNEQTEGILKKIDDLISALTEIQVLCNHKSLQQLQAEGGIEGETEEVLNKVNLEEGHVERISEEGVKFKINIDEGALIQCYSNRGKHSLKIIRNSSQTNYNPIIVHRCESDRVLTKNPKSISKFNFAHRKTSSETRCHQIRQLKRNHMAWPEKVPDMFLNCSLFKSYFIMQIRNIKDDVKSLKGVLHNIECMVRNGEKGIIPAHFDRNKKWFSTRESEIGYSTCDSEVQEEVRNLDDNRIVKAKTRATNFCKFYTLAKAHKKKTEPKKHSER